MLARKRLPGTVEGLAGLDFFQYWNVIKNRIEELRQLPNTVTNYAMKLGITVTNLKAQGRQDIVDVMQDDIRKVNDDLAKAWKVKENIDKYLPEWMKAAEGGTVKTNLSALPIVLGVAALAGLTYVVTTGMALVQDYALKKGLSPEQLPEVLKAGKSEDIFTKVGGGLQIGLVVLAIALGFTIYSYRSSSST